MLESSYLYTILLVSFDQTVPSATRISFLYSFVSVITGLFVGIVVRYVRYAKWFAVTGVLIFTLGMGLLVKFRGTAGDGQTSGMIGSQIVLGVAGGFTPYTVQAIVQAATKHERKLDISALDFMICSLAATDVALVTSLYLAAYNVGSALGAAISGVSSAILLNSHMTDDCRQAVWTNTLPEKLNLYLGNSTLATAAYSAPLTFVQSYPMGTEVRSQMVHAYNDAQRLLCITGVCLTVPFLAAALSLRNPRLVDSQSLEDAEEKYIKKVVAPGPAAGNEKA